MVLVHISDSTHEFLVFSATFSNILAISDMVTSISGGGSRSTLGKLLVNFIICGFL
jgi:hypothetical protein